MNRPSLRHPVPDPGRERRRPFPGPTPAPRSGHRRPGPSLVVAALLLTLAAARPARGAEPLTAEQIFAGIAPAVVHLEGPDSEGSGLLVHPSGYILTALHVVAAGTPMKVHFPAVEGRDASVVVPGARLFKVDPERDLAVVKVDLGERKMTPAPLDTETPLRPAATCFALGTPPGAGEDVGHTITQGIVSNPKRLIRGRPFTQFSAAVNPGSSGGVLVGTDGRVRGVVVAKMLEGEGIGYAIPMVGVDWTKFVDPDARQGDAARYEEALRQAGRARMAAGLGLATGGGAAPEALAAAHYRAREALTERPSDPAALEALIEVHYLANEPEVCLAIARSAWERFGHPRMLEIEARSLRQLGDEAQAAALYRRLLTKHPDRPSLLALEALIDFGRKQEPTDWHEIAYLARWAQVVTAGTPHANQGRHAEHLQQAAGHLDSTFVRRLVTLAEGFSLPHLEAFRRPDPDREEDPLMRAVDLDFYAPLLTRFDDPLELPEALRPAPAEDPTGDFVYRLPEPADFFLPANGGRLGLLVSRAADTVRVFDLASGRFIHKRRFPKGTLEQNFVMAGADTYVLIDRQRFAIQRFPLLGRGASSVIKPTGQSHDWKLFGGTMSAYRDDLCWVFQRVDDRINRALLFHFPSGRFLAPDHGPLTHIGQGELDRYHHYPERGYLCDPSGLFFTGGRRNSAMWLDSAFFSLRHAGSLHQHVNATSFGHRTPGKPIFVGDRHVAFWNGEDFADGQDCQDIYLGMGNLTTFPVHGSSAVVQLGRGLRILDPATGAERLPARMFPDTEDYSIPKKSTEFHVGGRQHFAIVAHRSSPRVAVLDFQTNILRSVHMSHWDWLDQESSPLWIRRQPGKTLRVPLSLPEGAELIDHRPNESSGFGVDLGAGEVVVEADAEPPYLEEYRPVLKFHLGEDRGFLLYRFRINGAE